MATTVNSQPYTLTAARDEAWIEVNGEGYATTPPTAHLVVFLAVYPNQPSAGDTISFTVPDGRTTVLTAVSGTPDDSGTQYQIGTDTEATFTNLLDCYRRNHLLNSLYQVTDVATYTARLTSRTAGYGNLIPVITGSSWLVMIGYYSGSNGDRKPNYRVGMAVFVERLWGSDVFVREPELSLSLDDAQRAKVDIAPFLLPHLQEATWPPLVGTAVVRSLSIQRRYYVAHWERYGTPPRDRAIAKTGVKYALLAGTRQVEHLGWQALSARLVTGGDGGLAPWMTYRGRGGRHEVTTTQRHYLGWRCWFARVDGESLTLRARVFYTDGTNTVNNTSVTSGTGTNDLQQHEVGQWPTGWTQLGLDAWSAGRIPVKYTVWITNASGTPVSEAHTFWLVEPDANERYLEFVNSLGVVESMRCIGRWVETLASTYTALTLPLPLSASHPHPSSEQAMNTQRTAGAQNTMDVHTGFADAAEHHALMDVAFSPDVRLVDAIHATRVPVRLAPGSHELRTVGEDGEHLYSLNLKLQVGDPEMAWSNIPATAP